MSNLLYGIISLVHHIPVLLLPSFIGLPLLIRFPGLSEQSWFNILTCLPMLLSPAWCIGGIVRGVRRRGERHGVTCAVMSLIGLVMFAAIMWAGFYLVSIGA